MSGLLLLQRWRNLAADVLDFGTAGGEGAASDRLCGRWGFSRETDSLLFLLRVCEGNCREKGLGVRMKGMVYQAVTVCFFDNLAAIHDCNPVGHALDHAQVVGDEQDRNAIFP